MRYYSSSREMSLPTNEDTVLDDEEIVNAAPDRTHKNYDRFSEGVPEGTRFAADYVGVEIVRRRGQPSTSKNDKGLDSNVGQPIAQT